MKGNEGKGLSTFLTTNYDLNLAIWEVSRPQAIIVCCLVMNKIKMMIYLNNILTILLSLVCLTSFIHYGDCLLSNGLFHTARSYSLNSFQKMKTNRQQIFATTTTSNAAMQNNRKTIVEFVVRQKIHQEVDILAMRSLYKEEKVNKTHIILDRAVSKVLTVVFNPVFFVLSIYFFLVGYKKIGDFFGGIFSRFSGKKNVEAVPAAVKEATAYQVYECEKCQMQLRPAKGRAKKVLSNPRFRCSRCGASASAYFDIDDMSDERAVERLERLKREENEDYGEDDEDDGSKNKE